MSRFDEPWSLPDYLTRVPGLVGDAADAAFDRGVVRTRAEALAEGLALQGMLACPCVTVGQGIRTNVMALTVHRRERQTYGTGVQAESALAHARFRCAVERQVGTLARLQSTLLRCPRLLIVDGAPSSFGRLISNWGGKGMPPVLVTLKRIQSRADGAYTVLRSKGSGRAMVANPCVCFLGGATRSEVARALRAKGLPARVLARFTLLRAAAPDYDVVDGTPFEPESVTRAVRTWCDRAPPMGPRDGPPGPLPSLQLPIMPEAARMLRAFGRRSDERDVAAGPVDGEVARGRGQENATRLAAVYACSARPDWPKVDAEAVEWAIAVEEHSARCGDACAAWDDDSAPGRKRGVR
jgi:hypothetical protein